MIGRILRIVFFMALTALVVGRILNRSHRRSLGEVVRISAWVFMAAAVSALGWWYWTWAG